MVREIGILRLSHRSFRDQRITTHVALTARAYGCNSFMYTGDKDMKLEETLKKVSQDFGGNFSIMHIQNAKKYMRSWQGLVIHLSMYGEKHNLTLNEIKTGKEKNILLVVGGSKVPFEIYKIADYNCAIGFQPHSEVAAIAIFLNELMGSENLYQVYNEAKIIIKPGKKANLSKVRSRNKMD